MYLVNRLRTFQRPLKSYNNILSNIISQERFIYTSKSLSFHEPDPEYHDKTPFYKHIRDGLFILKDEIKIWKHEVIETLEDDPLIVVPGTIDKVWSFEKPESIEKWVVTNDSDHGTGYSTSELTINEFGKGVFKGVLNTEVPADGAVYYTGFCNIRSTTPKKSFQRDNYFDWGMYTHLVFRVRGDGRPYLINIATPGFYDVVWNDVYQYVLHTRGGPYWQLTKIPFSKFCLSSKGKIQDAQTSIPLEQVSNVGLTMCDKVNGPFKLEIDYIGLEYDPDHTEEFAYEMYRLPRNMANS